MEVESNIVFDTHGNISIVSATNLLAEVDLPRWNTTKEVDPFMSPTAYGVARWLAGNTECGAYIDKPLEKNNVWFYTDKLEGFFVKPRDVPVSITVRKMSMHRDKVFWQNTFECHPSDRTCFVRVDDDYRCHTHVDLQTTTPEYWLPVGLSISSNYTIRHQELITNKQFKNSKPLFGYNTGCITIV